MHVYVICVSIVCYELNACMYVTRTKTAQHGSITQGHLGRKPCNRNQGATQVGFGPFPLSLLYVYKQTPLGLFSLLVTTTQHTQTLVLSSL